MSMTDDVKKIMVGVAIAGIVSFFTAVLGMHVKASNIEARIEYLEKAKVDVQDLKTAVVNLRILNAQAMSKIDSHEVTISKLSTVVTSTREEALTGLKILTRVAKDQESLVKVTTSLQVTLSKLETLVSVSLANAGNQ